MEQESDHRIWVSEDRCTLVTMWDSGIVTVATREEPAQTWGPPVLCEEERRYTAP